MAKTAKVIIFGARMNPPIGVCSCGDCCDRGKPSGILYKTLIEFIEGTEINEFVDFKFIDLLTDMSGGHVIMKDIAEIGYGFPIVTINGELKHYGGIPNSIIYQELKKLL